MDDRLHSNAPHGHIDPTLPQFLTTFTLSLMKSLEIRSEPAIRLLAEFLDMDNDGQRVYAEHFAHGEYGSVTGSIRKFAARLSLCSLRPHIAPFLSCT